jgi:cytidylate kinase
MDEKYVITVSHQLGSGGAYIGEKLSEALSIPFVDRDILKKVAEKLEVAEKSVEYREERLSSFWQAFSQAQMLTDPFLGITSECLLSDKELFLLESDYIARIAQKSSAVILGRGGNFILRDHPKHISVFVHAKLADRVNRVAELYKSDTAKAKKIVETNDRERSAYIKAFTRQEFSDAGNYDICINTSCIGLDESVNLIKEFTAIKLSKLI